jgi:hypothetical protein
MGSTETSGAGRIRWEFAAYRGKEDRGKEGREKKKWRVRGSFSEIGSGFQYQGTNKAGGKQTRPDIRGARKDIGSGVS